MHAVKGGLLHQAFERSVRFQKDDAVLARLIDGMDEQPGSLAGQLVQVGGPVQIVAVEDQERPGAEAVPARAQRVAGAARLDLVNDLPGGEVLLPGKILFDLFAQVVNDDDHPIDRGGHGPQGPVEDGPAANAQQRFGRLLGMRSQARAQTGGQDNGVHSFRVPPSPPAGGPSALSPDRTPSLYEAIGPGGAILSSFPPGAVDAIRATSECASQGGW